MDISVKEIDANTCILNVAEIDKVLERINKLSKKIIIIIEKSYLLPILLF